jgi:hypothetical protein
MPVIPESTKTSLAQRLRAHAKASYEDQIWFSGSIEEIFHMVCDLHVTNAGH